MDLRIYPLLALCLALACSETREPSSTADSGAVVAEEDAAVVCELAGDYDVTLTVLTGNCGAQPPSTLTIPEADVATAAETSTVGSVDVITMTVIKGCSVRLSQQQASRDGALVWHLDAESLRLVSEGTLEGQAEFRRFQDNAVICQGTYEMTLRLAP